MASGSEAGSIHLEEPRMEDRKTFLLAGLMKEYNAQNVSEIPLLWQQLSPHFARIPSQVDRKAYGVLYNTKNAAGFTYLAGVEVLTASEVPDDLNVIRIPEATFAVFKHLGHVSALKDTISTIVREWLPASGLSIAKADDEMPDMLEQYGESFDPKMGTGEIELWVPIKNRTREITFNDPKR